MSRKRELKPQAALPLEGAGDQVPVDARDLGQPKRWRAVFGEITGVPIKSISTSWRSACKRAAIVGLNFHDLRREFGCRLIESGAGLHDAREFLGHANISTTSRYLRASALSLARAIERLERAQAGVVCTNLAQTTRRGAKAPAEPVAKVLM